MQQITGQRAFLTRFEKNSLDFQYIHEFKQCLTRAVVNVHWTKQLVLHDAVPGAIQNSSILQAVLQFYKDFGSSFERMLGATGVWVVQLFLPEAHIACWNKLLCNYLIISLSYPLKKPTAIQLEANPVNPVLRLRIKTEGRQRFKAAVLAAIPPP